ncbi:HAMP domain-containing sensor histidine kinase [Yoonia sp. GPGPB17]|uniref:sensor histidine kinase n=1 Tax=Yoonia sp. GPGPB17 TaxID=3026147 RepID=UPI0030BB7664
MTRSVDARLIERMEAAIAALAADQPLPPLNNGDTADFVDSARRDGFQTRDADGTQTEMRYLLQTTSQGRLRLGEDVELQEELRDLLAGGMMVSLFATLIVMAVVGLWMARRSQARLNKVNVGLAAVARGDLATRIMLDGNDDLSLLAARIDATTARLENAMMQMRVQSSNIAHDLRTPLARLRAQLESSMTEAIDYGRPVTPETLEAALGQIDRITGTFEALLRLARIESGAGRDAFNIVHLDALVAEVAEIFGPVIEDAAQSLVVECVDPLAVWGDHDMLVQLLANLIQNALRHGASHQTITIRVHGPRVIVSDEGPGIPFAERENVLQPLHQGETTRQGEGVGLGLSLVRAIAELHSADLALSDGPNGHGMRVTIQFPKLH